MEVLKPQMIPILTREFVSLGELPVDLYIRLTGDKYVLLAKKGTSSGDRLSEYENKSVDTLYVRQEEYQIYAAKNLSLSVAMLSQDKIAVSKKAEFLVKASSSVLRQIDVQGFNKTTFDYTREVSQHTTILCDANPRILDVLNSLSQISDEIFAHSVAVSMFSVMIGKAMGWTAKGTIEKLSLGGLLHDIGLKQIDPAILKTPKPELSFEQLQSLESHAYRGMDLLSKIPTVPDDVVAIAYEHHENAIGQGYPRKLRDLRMNPLAKVAAVADQFVDLTLKTAERDFRVYTPEEAIDHMDRVMGQPFNREAFTALKVLLNHRSQKAA